MTLNKENIYYFEDKKQVQEFVESKWEKGDVPTLVITDIVGFAIFVNLLNSPKWFIPISITAASWSCKLNIVNGSPILLLLFPCVFKVLYF
jgi:hypothetical protein